MERFRNILSIPSLSIRSQELTTFIHTTATVEFRNLYPQLLENIFGWGSSPGWKLRTARREFSTSNTDDIIRFLRSDGPVLELAYRLMADPNLCYEFPVSALPFSLRKKVAAGDGPPFIVDKLSDKIYIPQPTASLNLMLNPFELFFFHYSYVELNQTMEISGHSSGNLAESIYYILLEDYMRCFVPTGTDRKLPPPLPQRVYQMEHPNYMIPTPTRENKSMLLDGFSPDRPTLFKASVFQNPAFRPDPRSGSTRNPSLESESWRTEVFLNILIFMWLSIDNADETNYQFETLLPTAELVRSIRLMVRHLHQFMNMLNTTVQHPLQEVKRVIFPVFQKKLYAFLNFLFMRWPLDHSFRIVYETWLSYIQPWRYSDSEFGRRIQSESSGAGEGSMCLDATQCNFVFDNLLFYTSLFQQVLHRISRVDLTSTRHAHMLYRITKVYSSIQNLKNVICEIEKNLMQDADTLNSSSNRKSFLNSFFESPSGFSSANASFNQSFNHNLSAVAETSFPSFVPSSLRLVNIRQLMREFEGNNVNYSPLFSEANRQRVALILDSISQALSTINQGSSTPCLKQKEGNRRFTWLWFYSVFQGINNNETTPIDDITQVERGRQVQFLTLAKDQLARLFNLPIPLETHYLPTPPANTAESYGTGIMNGSNSMLDNQIECDYQMEHDEFTDMVPITGRGDVISEGMEKIGNPDSGPARSNEISFCVPLLLNVSRLLNKLVCPVAEEFYFESGWRGRILRASLCEPAYYFDIKKLGPAQIVQERKYLPPRINLRFLATNNLPYFLIVIWLLSLFFKLNGFTLIFTGFMILLSYILLRAFMEPREYLTNVKRRFK